MFPTRLQIALSCAVLLLGGPALTQGAEADDVMETVEKLVDDQSSDGKPAGADLGEASYNIADCREVSEDGEPRADGGEEDGAEVDELDLDECDPIAR